MDEKQVYENQETAIKLLEENVELKKRIKEAIELLQDSFGYDDGDFESMRFQNDVMNILQGDKEESPH